MSDHASNVYLVWSGADLTFIGLRAADLQVTELQSLALHDLAF